LRSSLLDVLSRCALFAGLLFAAMGVPALHAAEESYLWIVHVGETDQRMPMLMVTMDPKAAAKVGTDAGIIVHRLDSADFVKVLAFFGSEEMKKKWTAPDQLTLAQFGAFEISVRLEDGTLRGYCLLMPRQAAIENFSRLAADLQKQKIALPLARNLLALVALIQPHDPP